MEDDVSTVSVLEGTQLNQFRWDEWVPEARLLKLNEAGFTKRRQLLEQQTAKSRPQASGSKAALARDKAGKKIDPKKRGRDSGVDTESDYLKRPEVKIIIPDTLKLQLVDDWENVTKNNQVRD